ncbi:MAG TPA: terminase family protein [Sphingomonas sp.]|jgi:uncharacterized protein YjcR|uniref:terminase large subunit domain-containing protein n=1 Tax=Sphingomonas sp. TaxID=28214 RepID=UPI002EDAF185
MIAHSHPQPAPADARRQARSLFWRGWSVSQAAEELGLNRATVESWKQREKWDEAPMIRKLEDSLELQYMALVAKQKWTPEEYKRLDALGRQVTTLARVRRFVAEGGHEGDLNDNVAKRNAAPKKKAKRNHFTAEQAEQLRQLFEEELFGYQTDWRASSSLRTRIILKSRQIGATWYFAREALIDAIETGRNQIFLSASKAQAHVFKNYIVQFALRVGVELKGDPIVLTSDLIPDGEPAAELHFLGTNSKTAQSYHGNFYFDEFFWVYNFTKLNNVAAAMASHKKWRKTYFSTPSSIAHEAYDFWTGEDQKKRPDYQKVDHSHAALKGGQLCVDHRWRQIVTLTDAEARGCDLFDHDEIRRDNAPDVYANLYDCQFVDDSLSAFKFNDMLACGKDSLVEWLDVDSEARRPYGDRTVWAGYDPQESDEGDYAALVICAAPNGPHEPFRLLERHQLRGDFDEQATFIKAMLARYNCTYLGIDATGVGAGVYQILAKPDSGIKGLRKIEYSLEVKSHMIMKAQHTIKRGRLQFDAGWLDVVSAFVSIKKTLTTSGRNITFKAGRSGGDGHADLAWAVMHILMNEPLDGKQTPGGTMEIF